MKRIGIPVLGLVLATVIVAINTPSPGAARERSEANITGAASLPTGGFVLGVWIVDPEPKEIFSLLTAGDTTIRGSRIDRHGVDGFAVYADGKFDHPNNYHFHKNVVKGGSTGLVLDLTLRRIEDRISRNVFSGQECGISVSIDIVFSYLPIGDRLEAFERVRPVLEDNNRFIGVLEPVCGARG